MEDITYLTAATAALEAAGLTPAQARFTELSLNDGLYYAVFSTGWVRFEVYVSAADGQVLGLSTEPAVDSEVLPYRYAPVFSIPGSTARTA